MNYLCHTQADSAQHVACCFCTCLLSALLVFFRLALVVNTFIAKDFETELFQMPMYLH